MQIPEISSFDQDVFMLVRHTKACYHRRVPIQVGGQIIDQVTNCMTEEELQSLLQSWILAYVSTIILLVGFGYSFIVYLGVLWTLIMCT